MQARRTFQAIKMKIRVVSVTHTNFSWIHHSGLYFLTEPLEVVINAELVSGGTAPMVITWTFEAGACTDGLSVPWLLRWFLPNWDDKNALYCIAGLCHDAGYASRASNMLSRSMVDDIFRGTLRLSGTNRFRAGAADLAVGLFACRHWGRDENKLSKKSHLSIELKNA